METHSTIKLGSYTANGTLVSESPITHIVYEGEPFSDGKYVAYCADGKRAFLTEGYLNRQHPGWQNLLVETQA